LRATWTPGNMALRGACSARDVRVRSSGGKVQGAVSAVLSATDAFRTARCPSGPRPARGLVPRRGGARAGGEGFLCGVGVPGPVVGERSG